MPMIGWPLNGEQLFNSKVLVEEVGVCLEITTGEDGVVERGRVVEVIRETEKGKKMRRRSAWRVKKVIREDGEFRGSSVRAMDDFTRTCSGYYLEGRMRRR